MITQDLQYIVLMVVVQILLKFQMYYFSCSFTPKLDQRLLLCCAKFLIWMYTWCTVCNICFYCMCSYVHFVFRLYFFFIWYIVLAVITKIKLYYMYTCTTIDQWRSITYLLLILFRITGFVIKRTRWWCSVNLDLPS